MASVVARVVALPPSPSRSFPRIHIAAFASLIAIAAGLLAPDAARAEVRRRAYLPTPTGVAVQDVNTSVPVPPGYTSATPHVLAFTPDGQTMYGVVQSTGDLLVYDLNSQDAPTVHALGLTNPTQMIVTLDGRKAYVARSSPNDVQVIDLLTMSVIRTLPTNAGPLGLSPDGTILYLMTSGSFTVIHRYWTADDSGTTGFGVLGFGASGMAISPDGQRAVLTDGATVSVVDLQTGDEEGRVTPGMSLGKVVITKDSTTALITSNSPINDLVFVNLDNRSYLTMGGALSSYPIADIDLEENGVYAWVHDPVNQVLIPIDIAGHAIPSGGGMGLVGSSPNGRFLGPLVYTNDGAPNTITTDADFTAAGFGQEVRVGGTLALGDGFLTGRTLRFVGPAPRLDIVGGATLSGTVMGSGFELAGTAAMLLMSGTGSLSGAIDVLGDVTLLANGTHTMPVTLRSSATLTGIGSVGNVTAKSGSTVRPGGNIIGTLTVDDITFESGSLLIIDIDGTLVGESDRLAANSAVIQPNVTLQTQGPWLPQPGDSFTLLTNVSGAGTFDGVPGGAYELIGVNTFARYDGGTGNDFTLTVDALPTGSAIANDTIDEDGVYNGAITIGDDMTPVNSMTVTATSNAQWLVPNANITVGPIGAARAIQIAPAANMSGTATITVRVADTHFYVERTFQLEVNSVNDAPTIAAIGAQTTAEDTATGSIAFDVDDIDTCVFNVLVTATSSNQAIVPDANIVVEGDDFHRTVRITPVANAHGTVTITLRAEDDQNDFSVQTFQLTVTPAADPPSISPIANQTIEQDATSGPLAFTLTDIDGFDDHTVTASSSNQTLAPNANLVIGGANGARTLTITPAAGQHGTATITVTVNDGTTDASTSFTLTVNEAPAPPTITYTLAEGATGTFFDTDLLLANPNAVAAPVTITWLLEGGGTIDDSRVLAPMSRTTIKVDDVEGLQSAAFSTQVVSTEGHAIAVERTMRWGAGSYGSHTEKAGEGSATTWYFAEGTTGSYFRTFLLLGNPHATANTATVEWFREGEPVLTRSYSLLPQSRRTIDTYADDELRDRAFGAKVTFDQPGVAERTMYFGADPLWTGGGAAAGQTSLSTRWDFAEGATGTYFTTFLLLANPGTTAANVTLTYFPQDGTPVTVTDAIAPGQRMTRNIALEHASLANAAVASRVESTQPIVAERAQYWGAPQWIESHNSFGVTAPGTRWALAEGRVGGDDEAQTYILLSNPGSAAATVTLTFLRADGTTLVKSVDVPAASRFTFGVTGPGSMAPELVNEAFGTLIESTQPIIVERSLYSNANGVIWAAGTNATATALPAPQ